METINLPDVLVIVGGICVAVAIQLTVGWVGLLGYAGLCSMLIGLVMARRVTNGKRTG